MNIIYDFKDDKSVLMNDSYSLSAIFSEKFFSN